MYSTIAATSLFLASAFTSPLAAPAPAPVPWDPNPIGIPQGIVNASFTVYDGCGASVSCGPSWAAEPGKGYAAINILQYSTPTNGAPDACGSCWHIQPQTDVYPSQGLSVGKPIVVKINNQCTDGGPCDQSTSNPLNSQYQTQLHFDLCADTGTWQPFFGQIPKGVLLGVATFDPDCSGWDDGQYGSSLGNVA